MIENKNQSNYKKIKNGKEDIVISKQALLYLIAQMPDDIDVFTTDKGKYDDIDIRIFLKSKSNEFYKFYFGM